MANPFTYKAYSALTWEPLDDLPYTGVTFGQAINAAATFSGNLPLTDPGVQNLAWQDATLEGQTCLFVDFLGTLVWGGLIGTTDYKESSRPQVMQVTGQTFNQWAAQRLQVFDYSTTWQGANATDPAQIALELVTNMLEGSFSGTTQGTDFGGPGVQVVVNYEEGYTSAPAVSVTYPGTQLQTIDSMLQTLSQMGYGAGIDYTWDVAYSDDEFGGLVPVITFNIWFPRAGRPIASSGLVINRGSVIDYSYTGDATQQANSLFVSGATLSGSGGTAPVEGVALNVIEEGWPLLEKAESHVQINDEAVLLEVAAGDLAVYQYPVTTPTITLPVPMPNPAAFPNEPGFLDPSVITFGDFDLGDDVTFVIDPAPVSASGQQVFGLNNSPRFPDGLNFTFRIIEWTCTVSDTGLSTILIDLAVPPLGSFPPPQAPH